MDTVENIEPTN